MDNPSDVDAGVTGRVTVRHSFAPCPTCGNASERQGAQLCPHPMHKIGHTLWTTVRDECVRPCLRRVLPVSPPPRQVS
ncbi:hypothetical protein ACE1SV_32850 [Streptomyces sp. E-15]